MSTEYVSPETTGTKCSRCGANRSERQRVSRTGIDEPPFVVRCVNVMWCGKRQERQR